MSTRRHLVIIGAGPIGLETALALRGQDFEITLLEQGVTAHAVLQWGHVRMFSPWNMNVSATGTTLLREAGHTLPADDAFPTGKEYAEGYLQPLGHLLKVQEHTRVKAICRASQHKRDHIGEPERSRTPFRLLVDQGGLERHVYADIVVDCTGVLANPNTLGDGGIPAMGEQTLKARIHYGLAQLAEPQVFQNRRVLLAGGGHSAATIATQLATIADCQVIWISKRPGPLPCERIEQDPLTERDQLSAAANTLVEAQRVEYHSETTVLEIREQGSRLHVTALQGESPLPLEVDEIISATGYRPDNLLARELHVQTCWATEGTYPLAASLLGESSPGGNCLAVPGFGIETLRHPEPDYYALGIKSYGRTPEFLIRTGIEQAHMLAKHLETSRE